MLRVPSEPRGALLHTCLRLFRLGIGTAVFSCGAGNAVAPASDAGGAGADTGKGDTDGVMCQFASDAAEPEVAAQVALDAGISLDQVAFATAVARCNYWSRCYPMAAYQLDECINSFSQSDGWTYVRCVPKNGRNSTDHDCFAVSPHGTRPNVGTPMSALRQAVDAGILAYDPEEEAACLQALQAQSCHGDDLWFNIPHCIGAFACVTDAGTLMTVVRAMQA